MFTVYILRSKATARTYVGYTADIKQRLLTHNQGSVFATKSFRPWELLYTETFESELEAKIKERYWKSGAGRRNLKKILSGSRPTFRKKLGEARSNLLEI